MGKKYGIVELNDFRIHYIMFLGIEFGRCCSLSIIIATYQLNPILRFYSIAFFLTTLIVRVFVVT
jgi:hypothetical protein